MQYRLRDAEQRVSPSLYCTPSACTANHQPVLHALSLYFGCALACTTHRQPLLHIISLYCISFACTSVVSQPVLHTLSLYCTYFIQGVDVSCENGRYILPNTKFSPAKDNGRSHIKVKPPPAPIFCVIVDYASNMRANGFGYSYFQLCF